MSKSVFISYNHKDKAYADMLLAELRANKINVVIDSESMAVGADIRGFIMDAMTKTDITLTIISRNSLLSAWVAMETINTFSSQAFGLQKRFIPCNIDKEFFDRDFTDKALDMLEGEIEKIGTVIQQRISKGRGIRDLENEINRYREHTHHLDEIVRKLRESLCADISGDNFKINLSKIIKAIKD